MVQIKEDQEALSATRRPELENNRQTIKMEVR